jgi:hypothetical protein
MRCDPPPSSLLSILPWLLDANSWALERGPHDPVSADEAGVWPVGNGWMFAHAGLAQPYNRLQGIVGPTYQTDAWHSPTGDYGDCWIELWGDTEISLSQQQIWRPRHSGILVTRGYRGPVSLITVDAALPERPVLVRWIEVWGCEHLGEDARVVVHLPTGMPHDPRRRSLRAKGHRGGKILILGAVAGRGAEPGRLHVRLADLPITGGVRQLVVAMACGATDAEAIGRLSLPTGAVTALEETRAYWSHWLERTRTPELWPQHLPGRTATERAMDDLIELNKINLKMQQARPGGGVSPMVHYKGVWARDSNGPVRAFLQMRALTEAGQLLEYYYRASIIQGKIASSLAVDLDTSDAREPGDWSAVDVSPAEVPSWIILQHRWWLEAGGDADLVRRHWGYLRRCATGQVTSPEGFQAFHGDETYLHGALYAIFPERAGWPNHLIAHDAESGYAPWSLDSMVAYVAAQEAMAWMCPLAGHEGEANEYRREADRVRAGIENHFWMDDHGYYAPAIYPLSGARHEAPFAPINLRPLWLGYHPPDDPRARKNLEAVMDLLGFGSITPTCEYTVGHAPGYLLWNLLEAGSDLAPLGLANLVSMASPAGEWAEVYGPGGRPHWSYRPDAPNRLRPCESGINLDAIYRYFQTRHPDDEPEREMRGIARATGTSGSGPVKAVRLPKPPSPARVVLVTADPAEIEETRRTGVAGPEELTVVEPGVPMGGSYFAELLFDAKTGERRVDVLILGSSALAGDRRSMKPPAFWSLPQVADALSRFEEAGGRLLRGGEQ